MNKSEIIKRFSLIPHPEGGYYQESYRAAGHISVNGENRNYSTAIYFLLGGGEKSKLHRLKSDEIWHFYLGDPVKLFLFFEDGKREKVVLGNDLAKGHKLQYVVPMGVWFGGYSQGEYSFLGCTVSPGFDFSDFELAKRDELFEKFPSDKDIITRLTG